MINRLLELTKSGLGIFELIMILILTLCALAILTSILINFIEAQRTGVKLKKKSVVTTGTMMLFFLIFYLIIRLKIGDIELNNLPLRIIIINLSLLVIVFGTIFNILGRVYLGRNWANQVKIYTNQTLITRGPYGIVRHPLYASLIWIFYGASLLYLNYTAFLLNTFIFLPFMYYRAKQEEEFLEKEFKNYRAYKSRVGIFFPKTIRWVAK